MSSSSAKLGSALTVLGMFMCSCAEKRTPTSTEPVPTAASAAAPPHLDAGREAEALDAPDASALLERLSGGDGGVFHDALLGPDGGQNGVGQSGPSSAPPDGKSVQPAIREVDVKVAGPLDMALVRRSIRKGFGQLGACREAAAKQDPKVGGRIEFDFVVGASGAIEQANRTLSTIHNAELEDCATRTFRALSFPKAPNGASTHVHYAIIYTAP